MCTASSSPEPTTRLAATALTRSRNGAWASPTVIASEAARHRCPAHPKALSATVDTAASTSASSSTTTGFFAPPWHWTRFPFPAARA